MLKNNYSTESSTDPQDTADRMIAFLNEGIVKKSDVEITITPTIEKVLSREDTIEDMITGLSIIGMFGEN